MGNVHSDASGRQAQDVLRYVPFLGPLYSGISAAVYAGKGDFKEAERRGIAMGYGVVETGALFV